MTAHADLVARLRAKSLDRLACWDAMGLAADAIEAQAAEIARLVARLDKLESEIESRCDEKTVAALRAALAGGEAPAVDSRIPNQGGSNVP